MAKGNLFLGMGRGSVGDVTFYRADGQQLSRARNRKPRNPKTNAQLIQRAISATIVQAYKAGSIIFDHSFEGKSVPAGSQRAFLSTNMRKLREQVLSEINQTAEQNTASVVSPRAVFPVPNSYRISEGSLLNNLIYVSFSEGELGAGLNEGENNQTVQQYLSARGVSAGEIYTICVFGSVLGQRSDLQSSECVFGFMRLTVKETAISSSTLMSAAKWVDIFDVDSSGAGLDPAKAVSTQIMISEIALNAASDGAMGVIRSNKNSGERSTCDMQTNKSLGGNNNWGVAPANLLASWSQDSGGTDSELILEGGDI